jgi:FkbM family methyltransferase
VTLLGRAIRGGLRRLGWSLERVRPAPAARVVFHAHYRGRRFECFKDEPVSEAILTGRGWDPQLPEILALLTDPARPHVIEVGANVGASLVPVAAEFPHLAFHCVEPVPEFFALLEENARTFAAPNLRLYHRALGPRDGEEVEIRVGYGTAGLSRLVTHHADMGRIRVASETLDTFAGEKRVGLLKLDVDGYELGVLRGATRVLRRDRPRIFMEYSLPYLRDVGASPGEVRDLLAPAGYDRITIFDAWGRRLATTRSYEELERTARETEQYVDVLLEASA